MEREFADDTLSKALDAIPEVRLPVPHNLESAPRPGGCAGVAAPCALRPGCCGSGCVLSTLMLQTAPKVPCALTSSHCGSLCPHLISLWSPMPSSHLSAIPYAPTLFQCGTLPKHACLQALHSPQALQPGRDSAQALKRKPAGSPASKGAAKEAFPQSKSSPALVGGGTRKVRSADTEQIRRYPRKR